MILLLLPTSVAINNGSCHHFDTGPFSLLQSNSSRACPLFCYVAPPHLKQRVRCRNFRIRITRLGGRFRRRKEIVAPEAPGLGTPEHKEWTSRC
jgi:hypothetical protein